MTGLARISTWMAAQAKFAAVWAGSGTAEPGGHAADYLEGAVQAAERATDAIIHQCGR